MQGNILIWCTENELWKEKVKIWGLTSVDISSVNITHSDYCLVAFEGSYERRNEWKQFILLSETHLNFFIYFEGYKKNKNSHLFTWFKKIQNLPEEFSSPLDISLAIL